MAGTSEGSKKAAETRKLHDEKAFSKLGRMGAEARHNKSSEEESRIAKKAAQTRKEHDPNAFKKMGEKGGSASRSDKSKRSEDEEE